MSARISRLAQAHRGRPRALDSLGGQRLDHLATLEDIVVLGHSGLVHQDLLGAQTEHLLGAIRQRERLAEAGQLKRIDACIGGNDHRKGLIGDPDDVHLGLLLGQRERAHLASRAKPHPVDSVLRLAQRRP